MTAHSFMQTSGQTQPCPHCRVPVPSNVQHTCDLCPHGDPGCPCPDGDACHYEPPDPWPCLHCDIDLELDRRLYNGTGPPAPLIGLLGTVTEPGRYDTAPPFGPAPDRIDVTYARIFDDQREDRA